MKEKKTILFRLKPAVTKRALLFIAGAVWAFAGGMLLWRGVGMLADYPKDVWWKLPACIPLGIAFYFFMFSKVFKKHSGRILALEQDKPCAFSFFNAKAYFMMISMIGLGVFLRASGIISTRYLSILYLVMGIPLSISAVLFFANGVKYFKTTRQEP